VATYNKYQNFVEDLAEKVHNCSDDTLKVMLSNTAPNAATHTVRADSSEISGGNGYTSGGTDTQNTGAESSGTYTLTGTKVVFTASGGSIGPFRYVILYNDTPTSPADPLISWWDYGSALTLLDGETLSVKFNNSDTTGTIFTLA
jgi:hypothetical protein